MSFGIRFLENYGNEESCFSIFGPPGALPAVSKCPQWKNCITLFEHLTDTYAAISDSRSTHGLEHTMLNG